MMSRAGEISVATQTDPSGFNGGNFTDDYARRVEQSLEAVENDILETWTQKVIGQQAAAAGVKESIQIQMPEHGRVLSFFRQVQIDPDSAVTVSFASGILA